LLIWYSPTTHLGWGWKHVCSPTKDVRDLSIYPPPIQGGTKLSVAEKELCRFEGKKGLFSGKEKKTANPHAFRERRGNVPLGGSQNRGAKER